MLQYVCGQEKTPIILQNLTIGCYSGSLVTFCCKYHCKIANIIVYTSKTMFLLFLKEGSFCRFCKLARAFHLILYTYRIFRI